MVGSVPSFFSPAEWRGLSRMEAMSDKCQHFLLLLPGGLNGEQLPSAHPPSAHLQLQRRAELEQGSTHGGESLLRSVSACYSS